MWSLFVNVLIICMAVVAIAFTVLIVIAMIYAIKEQLQNTE